MPGWVPQDRQRAIAARLGVERSHPAFADALRTAEERIERATGVVIGGTSTETRRYWVDPPALALPVPLDARSVTVTEPSGITGDLHLDRGLLYRYVDGEPQPWSGAYTLEIERGLDPVPEEFFEAVALLAAHLMAPPNPDESRLTSPAFGAGGGLRPSVLGVPEADALLARYLRRPAMEAL